ncbi:MerR family transcriptional regulator [Secundilactobacillus paracollinoides]|uniref:MerR family transcriptional regulator n=1 Tax=Secundilactobacillus paracollinoides TaxID=240427 RepID=UPI0006CF3E22|nr:MerR family transcriptional regulator [Secundilactobacillus paracollinoides]KRL80925.1 transcriptional regulator [Secundilactobacillus paracollinoides DSM 15502 = JCM 11969]
MTYTIKEVSEKVGLSIYTLRYYDKEGLLPFVARNDAGYREFTDGDLNIIHTICCLNNTGMKISAIRQYIADVMAGPASIDDRKRLFHDHREKILEQQRIIAENLKEIDYKLDIYDAPNAEDIVSRELQFAEAEKTANALENPYVKTLISH